MKPPVAEQPRATTQLTELPAPVPEPPRSRAKLYIAGTATVMLIGGIALLWHRSTSESAAHDIGEPAAPLPAPAPAPLPAIPDQAPAHVPDVPTVTVPDKTPATTITPRHTPISHLPVHPKIDTRNVVKIDPKATPPGPSAFTRKATINSQPWSYWTVDDDPTRHQGLEQILLTPGAHRIHFSGNEHFAVDKTMTIEVSPDHDFAQAWKLAD